MIPLRFSGFTIFQPTRPLRGATGGQGGILSLSPYFNPRAPCGARPEINGRQEFGHWISTHAPLAGRDVARAVRAVIVDISTHAPLAGRDASFTTCWSVQENFNPRAPCGARHLRHDHDRHGGHISTHAPLAGRDDADGDTLTVVEISTHAPLAGRDWGLVMSWTMNIDFNPRAPCGARRSITTDGCGVRIYFNPRAPCGARPSFFTPIPKTTKFQPTRPLRGATAKVYKSLCTFLR